MAKYRMLTNESFNQVKLLQQAELTPAEIKKITGRTPWTQTYIEKSKDFEEYRARIREFVAERNNKQRNKATGLAAANTNTVSVTPESPEYHLKLIIRHAEALLSALKAG